MKRRLHQPPLAQMDGILAGQESFAQQPLRPLQSAALDEEAIVRDQNITYVVRRVDENELFPAHSVSRDVAVGAREVREEGERIASRAVDQLIERREIRPRERPRGDARLR